MAAGSLPAPGTRYGPCEPDCHHTDCALTRQMAAEACIYCGAPIGYETPFYRDEERRPAHAVCLEDAFEKARGQHA